MVTSQMVEQICERMASIAEMCLKIREQSGLSSTQKSDASPVTVGDLAVQIIISGSWRTAQ